VLRHELVQSVASSTLEIHEKLANTSAIGKLPNRKDWLPYSLAKAINNLYGTLGDFDEVASKYSSIWNK
jgi:hypothetical protein